MVYIVPGVDDLPLGHGLEAPGLVHPAQSLVAQPGGVGLNGVGRAFGQVQGHGPVVRNGVDHMGETGVKSGLSRPNMGGDEGQLLG